LDLEKGKKAGEIDRSDQVREMSILRKESQGLVMELECRADQLNIREEEMYRLRKTILDMEEAEISNKEKLRHVTSSMNQQMSELERELREVLTEKEQMGEALQEEYQKWLDVEAKQKEHWEESESTRHN
jgi:hypothetical protein